MRRGWALAMVLLLAAAALRLPRLDLRPMHNDEAVNAIKFRALWEHNRYAYDPAEYHGPVVPYFTLPAALLSPSHDYNSFDESTYRRVTVVFGLGLVAAAFLLTRELGLAAALFAAAFTAFSPAMVFYSRYYIHEMPLVFLTAVTGIAAWKAGLPGARRWWWLAAGVAAGLMWATKETFVLALAAMAGAVAADALVAHWRGEKRPPTQWTLVHFVLAAVTALVVAALFFSSFFTNAKGLVDAIKTYSPWLHRAGGASPHIHPWWFYFQRLFFYRNAGGPWWSEGLVGLLALLGAIVALRKRGHPEGARSFPRLLAFYTIILTALYTLLPYKTPWCLLGFYHGMILLAGIGAAALVRSARPGVARTALACAVVAGTAQLGVQAWRGSFGADRGGVPYCATPRNPYVYSQTSPDALRLVAVVEGLAKAGPEGEATVVKVMSTDSYWPLPWYLRRFKNVGYWDAIPADPLAPIVISAAALNAHLDDRADKTLLMAGYYQLRPGVFFELYADHGLWSRYLKTPAASDD